MAIAAGVVGGLLLGVVSTARAREPIVFGFAGTPGADGVPPPWKFKRWSPVMGFGSFEASARIAQNDGKPVLCVKSVDSGFVVMVERKTEVGGLREVSWSWRAETLPKGGSFKARDTNDQALQVLFAFEGGKVVSYVWDTTGPVDATGSGLSWENDVQVIVLEAGASKLGQWVTERRNLHDDFRKLFGTEPSALKGVGVQSNSQHTQSSGAGCVGPILLGAK
jgi:hypothetical protein